jgi:hypothetical protein
MERFLQEYKHSGEFVALCRANDIAEASIIDASFIFSVLSSMVIRLLYLRELTGDSYDVFFKVNLWNIWNRIPFLDLPEYIAFIKEHGIPIIQDQSSIVPLGDGPQSCYPLTTSKALTGTDGSAVLRAQRYFSRV